MQRRTFISRLLASSVLTAVAGYVPRVIAEGFVTRQALRSLPAFLDTLLPEDEAPSASQLGIDRQLIAHATGIENYLRLLQLGCQWLDQQASRKSNLGFWQLDLQGREAVVTIAENATEDSVQKLFFDRVKSDAFTFYYSNPASWVAIGFTGPPQPAGYLDFAAPPRVSR
jgi:hypothetical protein